MPAIEEVQPKGPKARHKEKRETPIENAQRRKSQTPPPEEEGNLRAGVGRNGKNERRERAGPPRRRVPSPDNREQWIDQEAEEPGPECWS